MKPRIFFAAAGALAALLTSSLTSSSSPALAAEEQSLGRSTNDSFTWNHGRNSVYPLMEVDVGRKISAGAALILRGLGPAESDLRLQATAGADNLVQIGLADRLPLFDGRGELAVRVGYRRRPDGLFYGLGGETRSSDKTVFELTEPELGAALDRRFGGGVARLSLEVLFRAARFDGSDWSSAPSLEERFGSAGQPPVPAGWTGYQLLVGAGRLALDSRPGGIPGSGARACGDLGWAIDPRSSSTRFLRWGGTAQTWIDFTGRGHQLGLGVLTSLVERLGSAAVPFTELVALGGQHGMRGFLPGRLRGESALVGSLFYRQPIAARLQGELFLDGGNVFSGRLRELDITNLYPSYGLALYSRLARELAMNLVAGFGGTRVDASDFSAVKELRLTLNLGRGF